MKKQITFTRTGGLSEYQRYMFTVLETWGPQRFQIVTSCFKALFSDMDIKDPNRCAIIAFLLSQKGPASEQLDLDRSLVPAAQSRPLDAEVFEESEHVSDTETISEHEMEIGSEPGMMGKTETVADETDHGIDFLSMIDNQISDARS